MPSLLHLSICLLFSCASELWGRSPHYQQSLPTLFPISPSILHQHKAEKNDWKVPERTGHMPRTSSSRFNFPQTTKNVTKAPGCHSLTGISSSSLAWQDTTTPSSAMSDGPSKGWTIYTLGKHLLFRDFEQPPCAYEGTWQLPAQWRRSRPPFPSGSTSLGFKASSPSRGGTFPSSCKHQALFCLHSCFLWVSQKRLPYL